MALEALTGGLEQLRHVDLEGEAAGHGDFAVHEPEAAAGERKVSGAADDVLAGDREDRVEIDGRTVEEGDELLEERRRVALVEGEEHLLLAREVEVDRAFGDAGGLRHLGNARHAVGLLEVKGFGRIEDGVASLRLVLHRHRALLDDHVK